jgi:hypothetical protein
MNLSGPFVPRDLGFAVAVGALWGVACWWGDGSSLTFVRGLANTAGPWLLIAFAAGARSRAALPGAVLGALALLAAIGAYYLSLELLDAEGAANRLTLDAGNAWAVAALPVGAVFGLCGAAWRAGFAMPLAVGLLGGALFGEGLALLSDDVRVDLDYLIVPVAEIAAAFSLPTLLIEHRQAVWTIVAVAALGPLAFVAERELLDTVRGVIG